MENYNSGINNINSNNIANNNEVEVNATELMSALKHFNWGAFGFTWLWGLGNGSFHKTWHIIVFSLIFNIVPTLTFFILYLCKLPDAVSIILIAIITIAFILPIVITAIRYGMNGNQWAYKNRAWWSIEDFENTQRRWAAVFGIMIAVLAIVPIVLSLISFAMLITKFSN